MSECVYCGEDAGEHDEHDACTELAALEGMLEVALIGNVLEETPEGLYRMDRIRAVERELDTALDELLTPAARLELERRLDAAVLGAPAFRPADAATVRHA